MRRSGIIGVLFVMLLSLAAIALYNRFSGKSVATLGTGGA